MLGFRVSTCAETGAVLVLFCIGEGSFFAAEGESKLGAVTLRLDSTAGCGPTARRAIATCGRMLLVLFSDGRGIDSESDPSPVTFKAGGASFALEAEASLFVVIVSQSSNRLSRGRGIGCGIGEKEFCIVAFLSVEGSEGLAPPLLALAPTGLLGMLCIEGAVVADTGEILGSIVGSVGKAKGVNGVGGVGGAGGALIGGDGGDGGSGESLVGGVGGVGGARRAVGPGDPGGDTS